MCTFCNFFGMSVRASDAMVHHDTQRRTKYKSIYREKYSKNTRLNLSLFLLPISFSLFVCLVQNVKYHEWSDNSTELELKFGNRNWKNKIVCSNSTSTHQEEYGLTFYKPHLENYVWSFSFFVCVYANLRYNDWRAHTVVLLIKTPVDFIHI